MKNILKFLLHGYISLSAVCAITNATDNLNVDITGYSQNIAKNLTNIEQEQQLIRGVCERWILSRKMHYAGVKNDKGGWVNGCMHKELDTNTTKFENWEQSFNTIKIIVTLGLIKRNHLHDFSLLNSIKDPKIINGFWILHFVNLAVSKINEKEKNITLDNLKEQVLADFYNNEHLKKDENALHDMHSYIDTLDLFGMITTSMRVSMMMKQMPEYERSLYKNNQKQAVAPINFGNGINNCYLASLLQIINALDEKQIDDLGFKRFHKLIREYNNDYLQGKALKDEKGKLDPRGLFNKEYKNAWNNFAGIYSDVVKTLGKDPSKKLAVETIEKFYNSEKHFVEDKKRVSDYSEYEHIENSSSGNYELEKELDGLTITTPQGKVNSENPASEEKKTPTDPQDKATLNKNIQHSNKALFEQFDNLFSRSENKINLENKEHQKAINKFICIRKMQDLFYNKSAGDNIGGAYEMISEYFDIYKNKMIDLADMFYRETVEKDWQPVKLDTSLRARSPEDKDRGSLGKPLHLDGIATNKSDNFILSSYECIRANCIEQIFDLPKSIDTILDAIFYSKVDWIRYIKPKVLAKNTSNEIKEKLSIATQRIKDKIKKEFEVANKQIDITKIKFDCDAKKKANGNFVIVIKTILPDRSVREFKVNGLEFCHILSDKEVLDVKKRLRGLLVERLQKNITPNNILKEDWWSHIKKYLSSELTLPLQERDKNFSVKFKIDTDDLWQQFLQPGNTFQEKVGDILQYGLSTANVDGIKNIMKPSICLRLKNLPSVFVMDYANCTKNSVFWSMYWTNRDYFYTIDHGGKVSFYRLIGFSHHYLGHYNASVFSGFGKEGSNIKDMTDKLGWQTVDSYYDGSDSKSVKANYSGREDIKNLGCIRDFQVYQRIFPCK